ncbi:MAG: antibiotic biosynthesis monooxygenase [Deltaproteobacteria bacterium]|nr:MAG: antibiotic biosynthesis monooxygenase [Deltaproteobacteria bacterium]
MSGQVIVVAKIVAKKETVDSVKAECLKLIEPTRKEDGCVRYMLHQSLDNPATFLFVETWASEAALEQHVKTDHLQGFIQALDGQVDELTIDKTVEIA